MTRARATLVSAEHTQYYHCVQRAFLCGVDAVFGRDYEHSKLSDSNCISDVSNFGEYSYCHRNATKYQWIGDDAGH